ncbi:hypothetical protein AM1BK_20290 [Neobacillus kokaensis]|uniref:Uncharacterized protein n=1 Tax=Neobacillus kokaensis TaxID=2759023 RepID=A0ABQ3NA00_9BACI|nr:hypothetical protein AM1BK_20290 [Neobacillus kokaensis]
MGPDCFAGYYDSLDVFRANASQSLCDQLILQICHPHVNPAVQAHLIPDCPLLLLLSLVSYYLKYE